MTHIKFLIFTAILACSLSACGPLQQFDTNVQGQVNNEAVAYKKLTERIKNECDYISPNFPPRNKAMEDFACKEKIYNETLIPVAIAPDLVNSYIAKTRLATSEYAKGKISKEAMLVKYTQYETQYTQGFQQRYHLARSQAIQQQQAFASQLSELGQSLNNQESSNNNQCSALSIPPMASIGCKNVCLDGKWAEICG